MVVIFVSITPQTMMCRGISVSNTPQSPNILDQSFYYNNRGYQFRTKYLRNTVKHCDNGLWHNVDKPGPVRENNLQEAGLQCNALL